MLKCWPISHEGLLRKKLPQLQEALDGRVQPHHRILLKHILAHVAFLEQRWEQLQLEIEQRLPPFEEEMGLLLSIAGIQALSAAAILAEIGADMSRFPSAKHLACLRRSLPWEQAKRGQATQWQNEERQRGAAGCPSFSRVGHFAHQRQLPCCSVPSARSADWQEQSGSGCRAECACHYLSYLTHQKAV
jgi:Transposase IS116/IS110/IS902 family